MGEILLIPCAMAMPPQAHPASGPVQGNSPSSPLIATAAPRATALTTLGLRRSLPETARQPLVGEQAPAALPPHPQWGPPGLP